MRVCMLVYNNCTTDARVLKEAATLRAAGCEVEIVAVLDAKTVLHERHPDGVEVTRIDRRPLHYRLLWAVRRRRRQLRLARRRLRRAPRRLARGAVAGLRAIGLAGVLASFGLSPGRRGDAAHRPSAAAGAEGRRWTRGFAVLLAPIAAVSGAGVWALMRLHKPLMYFDWYLRVYRLRRSTTNIDAVHAHDLNTLPVGVALARRLGARLVFDAHELYPEVSTLGPVERRVWRVLEARLIHRADDVLTVCDSIADELVARHHIPRPSILLNCPEGVPLAVPDRERLRAHAGLLGDPRPIVLYQGGFAVNRGLPQLVRAAHAWPEAVLVLMGWGMLEASLRELIASEELEDRVRIVGPVARDELVTVASGAEVGVIPYEPVGLNNRYTTPNKLFEYINALLPVAATDLPELRRVLLGRDLGRTFAQVTAEAVGATVAELLGDASLRARIRENARAAREDFTWQRQSTELLRTYDAVTLDPARRRSRRSVSSSRGRR